MISIVKRARVLLFVAAAVLLSGSGWARPQSLQGLVSSTKSTTPVSNSDATDPLGRGTPRDAMRNFLGACHRKNYIRAAEYLDLSKLGKNDRTVRGPELARDLGILLDHNTQFELSRLDNTAQGKPEDSLPADTELLQTFNLNDQLYPLYLQRVNRNGTEIWLVSADSVLQISTLSALIEPSKIEKILPAPLVNITFLGTPIWAWIALILVIIILSALSRLLSRGAIALLKPIVERFTKSKNTYRWEEFTEPVRLLVSLAVFRACMEVIAPSALLRDYILKLLLLLSALGIAALLMAVVDVISDQVTSRLDPRQRALSFSVLPLGVRFIKICIFCLAVLAILAGWGYNTSTILAGLGVGGLAVALAAQKTIENLFGGISVISDRPVLVGDSCQFGTQSGTVEDIGLRSTKIRTADRTILTIPNAQFSTMTLENFSRRDRMWFHPTLKLRRGTSPDEIKKAMSVVEDILKAHPGVDATDVPVRFTKIALESFDLEIFSYVLTTDYNEFLRVQTELLLQIVKGLAEIHVVMAVPMTESIVTSTGGPSSDGAFRTIDVERDASQNAASSSRAGF